MRKRRNSFSRIGVLCVVLLIALGAMGTTYGVWSETLNIASIIKTGLIDTELDWQGSEVKPSTGGTGIGGYADGMTLRVYVTQAKMVDPQNVPVKYFCYFDIDNNTGFGTLPVNIDSYDIIPDESYAGVNATITGVVVGEQIDPGETITGSELHIYLMDNTWQDKDLYFTINVTVMLWNQ